MLKFEVAHVVSNFRDEDGRAYAMTMFNRHENGILVWAGKLHREAEVKAGEDIRVADYFQRITVSFMSWRDVDTFFTAKPFASLVDELAVKAKRREFPEGARPGWL